MIAIFAPYDRSEITLAAVRLAEVAQALGIEPIYCVEGIPEQGIHPVWDHKILATKAKSALWGKCAKASCCVWFQPHHLAKDIIGLVKEDMRHVFVPSWHRTKGTDLDWLFETSMVCCPNQAYYDLLLACRFGERKIDDKILTWARWDSGVTFLPRDGRLGERLKLLLLADHHAVDLCPSVVLSTVDGLLSDVEDCEVTVLSLKSWCKNDRKEWGKLSLEHPERLSLSFVRSHIEQRELYRAHDWFLSISPRADFALHAASAQAAGLPVIAWAVAPFNEYIVSGLNGLLVPCEIATDRNLAPTAIPAVSAFLRSCTTAFGSSMLFHELQQGIHAADDHGREFENFWATAWEAPIPHE